ncbi:hypothetical protein N865_16730 [Intrasporangium oryzae NRRL B-24470]|uniref:Ester cyclase n=1 Tax=Intrasporangium oryzae NRRL B-24470 TaxID=1386089 RepID=W9GEX6_9MICO|nr:ester cyclase [Intrasporangium oryzae]EWT03383.1 hypothetical protein N865_16730 [Intrasporangium oryzae NRRL B-24470]
MPNHAAQSVDRRFVEEVLNGHNLGVLPELVTDDFTEENPVPGQGPGREGLRDFLQQMFTAFPDLQWTVEQMVADDDMVMAWSTWQGTHLGAFLGIPPTGNRVSVEAWTRDVFRDGKISSSRILMDNLALLQQLGVTPAAGA